MLIVVEEILRHKEFSRRIIWVIGVTFALKCKTGTLNWPLFLSPFVSLLDNGILLCATNASFSWSREKKKSLISVTVVGEHRATATTTSGLVYSMV